MFAFFSHRKPLALVLCLFAGACLNEPRVADLSPPSFRDKPQIMLEVADVRVRNDYVPRGGTVEGRFPTSPAQGVEIWAQDRLKAVGTSGLLEVVIQDASVTEKPLPVKSGIEGALTKEPNIRYDGTLEVSLNLYTPERAIAKTHADARVNVSRELLEKTSESERRELFAAMTREMMSKLDTQLDHSIHEYFAGYIANN